MDGMLLMNDVLKEHHTAEGHYSLIRLAGEYTPARISEVFVHLSSESVMFSTLKKEVTGEVTGKELALRADVIDEFCRAWQAFKENTTLWLQIEQERKDRALQAEQARQLAVWKEVEQLAQSIPGLEIIAREDDRWDEDKEEYVPSQAWAVQHIGTNQSDMYNFTVDEVLTSVQETIEIYNQQVKHHENAEKSGWPGFWVESKENSQKFLATHRAFVASRSQEPVAQPAH